MVRDTHTRHTQQKQLQPHVHTRARTHAPRAWRRLLLGTSKGCCSFRLPMGSCVRRQLFCGRPPYIPGPHGEMVWDPVFPAFRAPHVPSRTFLGIMHRLVKQTYRTHMHSWQRKSTDAEHAQGTYTRAERGLACSPACAQAWLGLSEACCLHSSYTVVAKNIRHKNNSPGPEICQKMSTKSQFAAVTRRYPPFLHVLHATHCISGNIRRATKLFLWRIIFSTTVSAALMLCAAVCVPFVLSDVRGSVYASS